MPTEFVRVASTSEVAEGTMVSVEIGDDEVLLVYLNGTYYALNDRCTHAGAWLDMGTLLPATCEVMCPLHGGRFDVRTGAPTHEPCDTPVARYQVQVEGDAILVGPPQ
jgi:nitrite reductase/ring-hydroxylating ferredoxin subunit